MLADCGAMRLKRDRIWFFKCLRLVRGTLLVADAVAIPQSTSGDALNSSVYHRS